MPSQPAAGPAPSSPSPDRSESGWRHPVLLVVLTSLLTIAATQIGQWQADRASERTTIDDRRFTAYTEFVAAVTEGDRLLDEYAAHAVDADEAAAAAECEAYEAFEASTIEPARAAIELVGSQDAALEAGYLVTGLFCTGPVDAEWLCGRSATRTEDIQRFLDVVRQEAGGGAPVSRFRPNGQGC